MVFPADPAERSPKGDHNRRLALGLELERFAAEAGITTYENTWPDHEFSTDVATRVGEALERLEARPPSSQLVTNGPRETEPTNRTNPSTPDQPGAADIASTGADEDPYD